MNEQLHTVCKNGLLEFSKININDDYCKKWNIYEKDFICLTKNGELVRDTLYRVGGLDLSKLNKGKYFMLIKYVESFYSKDVMEISESKDPRHLEGRYCILDKNGNEKIEFKHFKYPYLIAGSCIYSINSNYYNIETGEYYCNADTSMESTDFLFLENRFDSNRSKRGVLKIDKRTGTWELFP